VTIQRNAKIGDNVIIWAGTSIGHRTTIADNCFFASHVAVSGFCNIGRNCFLGVNCCLANNLEIADDCIVGAGAVLVDDTSAGRIYVGNPAKPLPNRTTKEFISGEKNI
jgi:acetyltransferase-like isoleucine patch superfamily enzyme